MSSLLAGPVPAQTIDVRFYVFIFFHKNVF